MIGRFVDAHVADLTEAQLAALEALLEEPDQDILAWASGAAPIPPHIDPGIIRMMADFEEYMRDET